MISLVGQDECKRIYRETRSLYEKWSPMLGEAAYGFRVLYGPPVRCPPLLFIGYQPGGRGESAANGLDKGEHDSWPDVCDYAVANWPLARRLREVWGQDAIAASTGLNAVFFRAPTKAKWRQQDRSLRREVEAFSRSRCREIVELLKPEQIIVIGIETFDYLTNGEIVLKRNGRTLAKHGELWGAPADGVIHLSGARMSRADIEALKEHFGSVRTPK